MNVKQRSYLLFLIVFLISSLLLINGSLIYWNSLTLERNMKYQEDAHLARLNTLDLIRNLHLLDLGLRGYALVDNPNILAAIDTANVNKDGVIVRLEQLLKEQNFPNMSSFYSFRDSVENYFSLVGEMQNMLETGRRDEFLNLLDKDLGYDLYQKYKSFATTVYTFEDAVVNEAKQNFSEALRFSYLLQFALFLITAPALTYMAFYSARTFRVSDELQQFQKEKNRILEQQVHERTKEIQAQNEELLTQQEELAAHRDMLEGQNKIIAQSMEELQIIKSNLEDQVESRTQEVKNANAELVQRNNQLEQYAYITAHNLRAPVARLKGLVYIFEKIGAPDNQTREVVDKINNSALEMDEVLTDMNAILELKNKNYGSTGRVNVKTTLEKVKKILSDSIYESGALLKEDIQITLIHANEPYLESIIYNLFSNALKYRSEKRVLELSISTFKDGNDVVLKISDNGVGIDIDSYGQKLFGLYQRFHDHVGGKGMGLYLVKTQVEALGGSISVESKVDHGTTFTIAFKE